MYRTGRVGNRARLTRHGVLIRKTNKNSLGGASDRNKRGVAPRAVKSSVDMSRRGATTLDVLAFTNAIRGAATNTLLFHKTGVMRYDPLKKNVVRPFRALFSLVFGIVRGIVHSAFAVATCSRGLLPKSKHQMQDGVSKSVSSSKALQMRTGGLDNAAGSTRHELVSHPLDWMKRSQSELQPSSSFHSRELLSRCESVKSRMDTEIDAVLKTYNTTESRDRLISKLKSMKSDSTDCIKNLSQRNHATERPAPMSRRQLLECKQEMVQLSKQISVSTDRPQSNSRFRRCKSAAGGSVARNDIESTLHIRKFTLPNVMSPTLDAPVAQPSEAGADLIPVDASSTTVRSEVVKQKLRKHESMVDSLKSRTAVRKILDGKTHCRSNSDTDLASK
eukprot:g507.t1